MEDPTSVNTSDIRILTNNVTVCTYTRRTCCIHIYMYICMFT